MASRWKRQTETGRRRPPPGSLAARYVETAEEYEWRLRRDRVLGTVGLAIFGLLLLLNLIMEWCHRPGCFQEGIPRPTSSSLLSGWPTAAGSVSMLA